MIQNVGAAAVNEAQKPLETDHDCVLCENAVPPLTHSTTNNEQALETRGLVFSSSTPYRYCETFKLLIYLHSAAATNSFSPGLRLSTVNCRSTQAHIYNRHNIYILRHANEIAADLVCNEI